MNLQVFTWVSQFAYEVGTIEVAVVQSLSLQVEALSEYQHVFPFVSFIASHNVLF